MAEGEHEGIVREDGRAAREYGGAVGEQRIAVWTKRSLAQKQSGDG